MRLERTHRRPATPRGAVCLKPHPAPAEEHGMTTPPTPPAPPARLQMVCPNLRCRKLLSVPAIARGRKVRCKHCSMRISVPAGGAK